MPYDVDRICQWGKLRGGHDEMRQGYIVGHVKSMANGVNECYADCPWLHCA
jgi:hypothetical protein